MLFHSSKYLNCIVFYIVPAGAEGETASAIKPRAADAEKNALSKSTFAFSAARSKPYSILHCPSWCGRRDCGINTKVEILRLIHLCVSELTSLWDDIHLLNSCGCVQ
jgi:hypothetical protein